MEFVDYNGNDITSTIVQPNDNLLTNADFKNGIINQKGQTTYNVSNAWTYTIDRWCMFYNNLEIEDGSVRVYQISGNSGTSYFKQMFDKPLPTGDYTLYINVLGKSGTITVELHQLLRTLQIGENIFIFENCSPDQVQINITGSGAYVQLESIKFEKGSYFTGMPIYNESEELLKCYRKYITFIGNPIKRVMFTGTLYAYITYELPVEMDKIPTVIKTDDNVSALWQNDNTSNPINTVITGASVEAMQGNSITIKIDGNFGNATWRVAYCSSLGIALDANNYG